MKKILAWLFCCSILLSGCAGNRHEENSPLPIVSHPPETETQDTVPALPLPEQGIPVGEYGNLLYIPNDAVESMVCPEVRLFGNGLLLSAHIRNQYVLRHISLEDGTLLNECSISASPGVKVRIGNGCVGLLDSGTNRFLLLNEDLTVRSTLSIPTEGDSWYLSPELDTLYRFYTDSGLLALDLQTGEERWIVENAIFTNVIGPDTEYVLFEYTDREDQRTYTRCLNLSTGTLETVPESGSISMGTRRGETWLLRKSGTMGDYILTDGDSAFSFSWDQSAVTLLSHRRHLLLTDLSGRKLQLYDTHGRFVSACTLPEADFATAGTDLVWSGYRNGYFFTDTIDGVYRLMFWDIAPQTQGEDLEMIPMEQPQPPQPVVEAALYDRASALSERFGITILIAEQCAPEYSHYTTHHMTDPFSIRLALDTLEKCLEMYPEGFFRQLPYGSFDRIQIELTGELTLKDSTANQPESTAAFVHEQDGYIRMVINGYLFNSGTVYHEFSHIIDRRLAWDANIRKDALYSEKRWLALQPEGFAYALSYVDMPEETFRFAGSGYFTQDYSMTYPTEDRATLMAAAMQQHALVEASPHIQEKLDYYARCIRDCFDTEGWPEITVWERPLKTD